MRAIALLLLALIACSERAKPNTPRDAVRGFGAALAEFDYEGMLPFVVGDEADLEHLQAFFDWGRACAEFRMKFLAAYGEAGWAEFNDNAEATISVVQNRNLDRFNHVRYEVDGDRAVGTLPNDSQKLHLARDDARWMIRLRETMALGETQLRDDAALYRKLAPLIRGAIPRIGAEGVTPAALDTQLAAEFEAVFRETGRLR